MNDKNKEYFTTEILSQLVTDIGVAFWVWDIKEDNFYYNSSFYDLIGYEYDQDPINSIDMEKIIHPDDYKKALKALRAYYDGENDNYSVEIRIIKPNNEVVWIYDVGKITKVDEDGKPLQISGITQNISKRKLYEEQFQKEQKKLKLAMKFAGFSVWEWDIQKKKIIYDKDYIKSLGYTSDDYDKMLDNWGTIIHPDDTSKIKTCVDRYMSKEDFSYDHKLRIRKSNGEYIWVRDICEVSEYDETGIPMQVIGGRVNINELENAKIKLTDYQQGLEEQISQRTAELQRRDTVLLELNQISQKLMATPTGPDFNELAYSYLDEFSSLQNNARLAIFRNKRVHGRTFCYLDNTPKTPYKSHFTLDDVRERFKDISIEFISEGAYVEEQREEFYKVILDINRGIDFSNIDYQNDFPTVYEHVLHNKTLNIETQDFTPKEYIFTHLQGIKSVMMAPIVLNNKFWGYILIDDHNGHNFTTEDEKTLTLVGVVIAQAVHKNELELLANEAIEHNNLMLDANPLCCNLWKHGVNIGSNLETARLFGLEHQNQVNEKFHLLSPEFQPCGSPSGELAAQKFAEAARDGRVVFEWLHQNLQGDLIPAEVTLVRIKRTRDTLIAGYVRDLREFKALMKQIEETQENLKQAHEEALLSSQAKSNFLANMSHEIRTPMNAISGMTDIILRETVDKDVEEYALNIKRASESLLAIINDVLDISKIESGKLDIVEGEYKLSHVLNDVLTIATNRLELKPLMFTTNFQPDIPNNLIGDDIRIKQIMVNILNNAIKFTSDGSISFDVSGNFACGLLELTIAISDTGSGISQDDMEKLFIEFERVNTTKNRTIEGTGLGLAISKRLCDMMNGTITVESELGKGTTFTITVCQNYNDYEPLAKVEKPKSVLVFESRELYLNSIEQACKSLELEDVVYCSLQSELNDALQERSFSYIFTSSMYLIKVQEMLLKYDFDSKIVLLADSSNIKARYDYPTIVLPANSLSIANILNGKTMKNDESNTLVNFIAPECNVLVVDDNLVNIKVAQGLMKPYQFKIDTAENGEEAVNKIKANKYDMVFMDHMMPIMDGIDATIAVRSLEGEYYQNIPIVALTANAIIGTKEMFINEGMNDFIAKPIKLSALNDVLLKWLPSEKQVIVNEDDEIVEEEEVIQEIIVSALDSNLGLQRVGGDFSTYLDILDMYYKDGLKKTTKIRDLFDTKQLLDYKIEVHALKSASASVGAMDISEKARLLEEAAQKEDWTYINQNTLEFIDDFSILLENIREALNGLIKTTDNASKTAGEESMYMSILKELADALDMIDINACEELLAKLFEFNWDDDKLGVLNKIKDFVDGYEYDEAVEVIEEILG